MANDLLCPQYLSTNLIYTTGLCCVHVCGSARLIVADALSKCPSIVVAGEAGHDTVARWGLSNQMNALVPSWTMQLRLHYTVCLLFLDIFRLLRLLILLPLLQLQSSARTDVFAAVQCGLFPNQRLSTATICLLSIFHVILVSLVEPICCSEFQSRHIDQG